MTAPPAVGIATSLGGRPANADHATYHRRPNGTTAVALADFIGSEPDAVEGAHVAAEFAARIGARHNAMEGVNAAAAAFRDTDLEFPTPDGVIVMAVARPGEPNVIAHLGDCAGYAFDGTELTPLTTAQTKAQRLLHEGHADDDKIRRTHHVPITSLARAAPTTISLAETFAQVIVLLSDGVHGACPHQQLADIVRAHAEDAQACAQALVDAARKNRPNGDNATAAVLIHPEPLIVNEKRLGR